MENNVPNIGRSKEKIVLLVKGILEKTSLNGLLILLVATALIVKMAETCNAVLFKR